MAWAESGVGSDCARVFLACRVCRLEVLAPCPSALFRAVPLCLAPSWPTTKLRMADDEDMAGSSAGEGGSPGAAKKRVQRKPKRRTMDAHFWGMSDVEIAAIKASLAAEAGDDGSDGGKDATTNDEDRQQDGAEEQEEQAEQVEEVPEGQLSKEEIQERRKILHTDWRMAAFSQFAHCFPHLCIKEFSIEKLERDLEGTEPGSYVGEVISRLLYHLTKDSALA